MVGVFVVVAVSAAGHGMQPRALGMRGKGSCTAPHPSPTSVPYSFLFDTVLSCLFP